MRGVERRLSLERNALGAFRSSRKAKHWCVKQSFFEGSVDGLGWVGLKKVEP